MSQLNLNQTNDAEIADSSWKSLYKVGGTAALITVLVTLLDIIISFLLGESEAGPGTRTIIDWFTLFQDNWFLGFRDLGLLNIINMAFAVPLFLALYAAHRRVNKPYAALAAILSFIGTAIYITNNQAFPMFTLSGQYAAAITEAQKSLLVAAGKAMLAQGEDLTAGTFMGFFFPSVAGIVMAMVMLQSRIFSKLTALAGILGFGLLLIFVICVAFAPVIFNLAMIFAMGGGLLSIIWNILIARRLFQLGRIEKQKLPKQ